MSNLRLLLTISSLLLMHALTAQLTYSQLFVEYDSAIVYKNLRVIPIRYKGGGPGAPQLNNTVSLGQALKQGLVTVQERGTTAIENVHWLSLYNNSDKDIFVSSGEVLEGGRQDRIVSRDTIVNARSGRIDLPVMCVEEGRWSKKDKKFAYRKMANIHLRKILDETRSQVQVWKEIDTQLDKGKIKNKTLAYLARDREKAFTLEQNDYWLHFKDRLGQSDSTVVGIVCMTGDKIIGSDIFISPQLFYQQLQPMMLGYIEEAIAFGNKPTVTDASVKTYLDQFLVDEAIQENFLKKNGKAYKAGGKIIHLTTY